MLPHKPACWHTRAMAYKRAWQGTMIEVLLPAPEKYQLSQALYNKIKTSGKKTFITFAPYIMEYNTRRNHLSMREYGRHIQKMVEYVLSIEETDKRQQQAQVVIELMGFLNPHLRNVEDFRHKLWDHLFYISQFKLEVASPYPIPQKETYKAKPDPLPYPKRYPKYSHLGKNLEIVLNKALNETDEEKRVGFANAIAIGRAHV